MIHEKPSTIISNVAILTHINNHQPSYGNIKKQSTINHIHYNHYPLDNHYPLSMKNNKPSYPKSHQPSTIVSNVAILTTINHQ